jgi:uncharacterized protein
MSPFQRQLIKSARTFHLYATLLALVVILFFTLTGFMLNHEDWFGTSDPRTIELKGTLPEQFLSAPDKLGIVENLRANFGAVGAMSSFEIEDDSLRVVFKRPGTEVTAVIDRKSGAVESSIQTRGVAGLLLDLHRGKSTGFAWSLLIDITCLVLALISATGIILWGTLKGRGKFGFVVILIGFLFTLLAYWKGVP